MWLFLLAPLPPWNVSIAPGGIYNFSHKDKNHTQKDGERGFLTTPESIALALVCLQMEKKKKLIWFFLLFFIKHMSSLHSPIGFIQSQSKRSSCDERRRKCQHPHPFPPPVLGASKDVFYNIHWYIRSPKALLDWERFRDWLTDTIIAIPSNIEQQKMNCYN